MLACDDMINGKCQAGKTLRQTAIFALVRRPLADQLFEHPVHAVSRRRIVFFERDTRLGLENGQECIRGYEFIQFLRFLLG